MKAYEEMTPYDIYKAILDLSPPEQQRILQSLPASKREGVERFLSTDAELKEIDAAAGEPEAQQTVQVDNDIRSVVKSFTDHLLTNDPAAGLDDFLNDPRIDEEHRIQLFRKLLATERSHRKRWNRENPSHPPLPVDYESYWKRTFFHSAYERETVGVMIAEHGYRFVDEIGAGGMGRVMLVENDRFDEGRQEALKVVLLKRLAEGWDEGNRGLFRQRFVREYEALASLNHTNLPAVYTQDSIDGLQYFTMRYVNGLTLFADVANGAAWPEDAVIKRMVPLARLVHQLHTNPKKRIIHRDLHPDNFIWDDAQKLVFLIDFGLARPLEASRLTAMGQGFGRPRYWPPEQMSNADDADERSDVYTFGATLYYLLTRRDEPEERERNLHSREERSGQISEGMADVCLRALQHMREMRYQSMEELANALEAIGCESQPSTTPISTSSSSIEPVNVDRPPALPGIVHPLAEVLPALALFTLLNMVAATGVFPYTKGLLFLDTIGTCAIALTFGPWYGAACGALTNILWALVFGPQDHYQDFAIVNAALGFYWGYLSCRWPNISDLDKPPRFASRLAFPMIYGIGGAILAALLVGPIHIWKLRLSVTEPIENIVILYSAILGLFGREPPDFVRFVSLFAGYMLYTIPDKVASTSLAWLIMAFFMPLYKKNASLFASVRSIVVEHAGPWFCVFSAAVAMFLLLLWGEYSLVLCWILPVLLPLVCLAHYKSTIPATKSERLQVYSTDWKELRTKLDSYRRTNLVDAAIKRVFFSGVTIVIYYFVWYWLADQLHLPGEGAKVLSGSILKVIYLFAVISIVAVLILRIIADNIGYLQVQSARDESKTDRSVK